MESEIRWRMKRGNEIRQKERIEKEMRRHDEDGKNRNVCDHGVIEEGREEQGKEMKGGKKEMRKERQKIIRI